MRRPTTLKSHFQDSNLSSIFFINNIIQKSLELSKIQFNKGKLKEAQQLSEYLSKKELCKGLITSAQ